MQIGTVYNFFFFASIKAKNKQDQNPCWLGCRETHSRAVQVSFEGSNLTLCTNMINVHAPWPYKNIPPRCSLNIVYNKEKIGNNNPNIHEGKID